MSVESKKHAQLWPVVVGLVSVGALALLVVCAVLTAAAANAQSAREDAEARLKTTQRQVLDVAIQRDAARTALQGCAAAYDTASEVSQELRDEMSDALDTLGNYASSYGTTTLDSSDLVARITATNEKQAAIDSSGCEATP